MDDLDFIKTDANEIYRQILSELEISVDESLYPGDERRLFGEAMVPLFVAMYNSINDAARQIMLRYARGEVLDALGERVGVERIQPEPATTTLRFSVNAPVVENVIIPEGTRATSDNARYFATDRAAVIQAGQLSIDVTATSTDGGIRFNGISAGSISTLVDLIAFVDTVSNLTETAGGTDEETDESLRDRIRAAPSKLSTAGPVNGYKYYATSADASIADVTVKSVTENIVRTLQVNGWKAYKGGSALFLDTLVVYAHGGTEPAELDVDYTAEYEDDLLTITIDAGGALASETSIDITIDDENRGVVKLVPICYDGLPTPAILAKVLAACTASDVRPLTDKVIAVPPDVQEFDIVLKYYTTAAQESACIETIEGEGGAIDQYIEWQSSALDRDINPDKLRALILAPSGDSSVGAVRVEITSPTYEALDDTTIAQHSGTLTVTHEVIS